MSENLAEEKVETTQEEKDVEVTLEENNEPIVNSTTEDKPDSGQVEQKTDEPDDKELQDVGKRAQDRIKKLTTKYKNEERAKQEAERKAQEAALENQKLKERLSNLDQGYISEYGTRLDAQLDQAKKNYRDAHEAGDVDKMFDAQQALSKISIEQERHRIAKDRQDAQSKQVTEQPQSGAQPQPQPQAAPVDPKAQAWAEKNDWFGDDQVMTSTAMGIHQKLSEEGFDLSSDEYYDEIDRQLKGLFPDKFTAERANGGSARVAPADTSASRKKQGRRTVRLSPSQVAMAKKLNVDNFFCEFNVIDNFWTARVTSHIPIKEVSSHIKKENILKPIKLINEAMKLNGIKSPRVAVQALNPHAEFGTEEKDEIIPAIEEAKKIGINADGPLPCDTSFITAYKNKNHDCIVGMYHDALQSGLKAFGFDRGVTVQGGLPLPITTPAHGTAFDIAGKNQANLEPTLNSFKIALTMAENKNKQ